MRIGYFGPDGTFTAEALRAALGAAAGEHELVAFPTIHDAVQAVDGGEVDRALVPIENSLEGSVNATLDALAGETRRAAIIGEFVHPIRHCLIAREELALGDIGFVLSHPQPLAQCARFLRTRLPAARVVPAASSAEAVRHVAEGRGDEAALGTHLAAELFGCVVIADGVEDMEGNETRFVWLGPAGEANEVSEQDPGAPWKTSIVFWGAGAEQPGWLVRSLAECASRGVNLTRIESRPRRQGLGRYMFFLDIEGSVENTAVAEALGAVAGHVEHLDVLGSYPAAPPGPER